MTDLFYVYHKDNQKTYGPWPKEELDDFMKQQGEDQCSVIPVSVSEKSSPEPEPDIVSEKTPMGTMKGKANQ
jgi:hypothetical protein